MIEDNIVPEEEIILYCKEMEGKLIEKLQREKEIICKQISEANANLKGEKLYVTCCSSLSDPSFLNKKG